MDKNIMILNIFKKKEKTISYEEAREALEEKK